MRTSENLVKQTSVLIPAGSDSLRGDLRIPAGAAGVILFAHGSGSSRLSPRNRYVAEALNGHSLGTLLIDLLTPQEEQEEQVTGHLRFNIDLLARRLSAVADWLTRNDEQTVNRIGLFGASTGAAAALITAAERPDVVQAVVSRGGRPDLAGPKAALVRAPTLLIVGGRDPAVLKMNRDAMRLLTCRTELRILPGATHLFEEPGALEAVAAAAAQWFTLHLGQVSRSTKDE